MKKLFSLFLTLVLCFGLLPGAAFAADAYKLWVAGVQVTSDNAAAVTGEGISGTVTYDHASRTLTLDSASIVCQSEGTAAQDYCGIYFGNSSSELTIALVGDNTVTGRDVTDAESTVDTVGVYSTYNYTLHITGSGTLTAVGGANAGKGASIGLRSVRNLDASAAVTGVGGSTASGMSCGLYCLRNVTLAEDATLTGRGGHAASGTSCGLYLYGYTLSAGTLDGRGGTSDASHSYGVRFGGDVTLDGASLTALGGDAPAGNSCGVRNDGDYSASFTLQSGALTATGGNGLNSYGLYANRSLSVSGGEADLTGGSASTGESAGAYVSACDVTGGTLTATGGSTAGGVSAGVHVAGGAPSFQGDALLRGGDAGEGASYGLFVDEDSYYAPAFSQPAVLQAGTGATAQATSRKPSLQEGIAVVAASVNADGSSPTDYVEDDWATYQYLRFGAPGTGVCGDQLTWSITGGTLTISGTGYMYNFSNWSPWYASRETITQVVLPEGVTSIGQNAFNSCTALSGVNLPEGVVSIGQNAFSNCTGLTSIGLPSSLRELGDGAFSSSGLTSIDIPEGVTAIPASAFDHCLSLRSVKLPDGVTSIGRLAFNHCETMDDCPLPAGLTTLGEYAFRSTALTAIDFPAGLSSLPNYAFAFCPGLTELIFPETLQSIGAYTFSYCDNLERVELSRKTTYMGGVAFGYCPKLATVIMKGPMYGWGDYAFVRCSGDLEITATMRTANDVPGQFGYRNETTPYTVREIYGIPGGNTQSYRNKTWYEYNFHAATTTIHFDPNGAPQGSMADWTHTYVGTEEGDKLPALGFSWPGAHFVCWYPEPELPAWYTDMRFGDEAQMTLLLSVEGETGTLYAIWEPDEVYDLWIEGVQVNSANASDVLGDGTVSYDAENKVLTLNGYRTGESAGQKTGYNYLPAARATIGSQIADLTIRVTGDSTVTGNTTDYTGYYQDYAIYTNYSNTTIDVAAGVTLTLNGGTDNGFSIALGSQTTTTVTGEGTLVCNGGTVTGTSYAAAVYGSLVIDGAHVIANGGTTTNGGYYAFIGSVTVNSGSLVATGGEGAAATSWKIIAGEGLAIFAGDDAASAERVESDTYQGDDHYVRVREPGTFTVSVAPGEHMTREGDGALTQTVSEGTAMTALRFTADEGFYFPEDYATLLTLDGVTVTREGYGAVTVSGMPLANVTLTLAAATAKEPEPTPAAVFTADGYASGTLTGLSAGMYYCVGADDAGWKEAAGASEVLASVQPGVIRVVQPATDADTRLDSETQIITVTRAETPALTAVQPASIGGAGSIPTTELHEFSTDGETFTACAGALEDLAPGTYYVRVKAAGAVLASETQTIVIEAFVPAKEPTPAAVFTADGYDTGTLTGLDAAIAFSPDGEAWFTAESDSAQLTGLAPGSITLVRRGNGETTVDSDPQVITVTRADTPALTAVQPTEEGGVGSIPTTAAHEFSTDGKTFLPCTGALEGLEPGTYYVRVKAAGTALTSEAQTIVIRAFVPAVTYTVTFVTGGEPIAVTVEEGQKVAAPADPVKDGCVFTGWYTDEACTLPYDFTAPVSGDLTLYAGWEAVTYALEGGADGAAWTPGSGSGLELVFHRSAHDEETFQRFLGVEVDGKELASSCYTAVSGSLRLTFTPAYLETLEPGEHTGKVLFTDGEVPFAFRIEEAPAPASPQTGDTARLMLWYALAGLSALAVVALVASRRRPRPRRLSR